MKKALAWLLVLAMTAALAVGGTLAYLTDTDEDVNVMTVGKVRIDQLEYERMDSETTGDEAEVQEFHNNKPLYPAVTENGFSWDTTDGTVNWDQIGKDDYTSGIWDPTKINNEQDKMVFVKNKGDFDAYVRTVFAFEAGNYETLDEYLADVHINLNDVDWTWEWAKTPITIGDAAYFVAVATYNEILAPGALTEISLSQIALDPSVTNEDVAGFGDTYQVLVQSQAVQAAGFDNAAVALTEAFGAVIGNIGTEDAPQIDVIPEDVPFQDDNPISGTDVKTAIHYLGGDKSNTFISANVTSVTFGLNKDHQDIVDNYEGTLVDVEQDVPVYAYYVQKGDNYDVYFLANDDIYAPQNCYELFRDGVNMSKLTKVNTENLNTSRTTVMSRMFRDCPVLTEVDVSGFDTNAVTAMDYMFYRCYQLQSLDVSSWDVSDVTTFSRMFYKCNQLSKITGLPNWNPEKVTDMKSMFYVCSSLTDVGDLSNWDTGEVTNMQWMFYDCTGLKELKANNWDTSNLTTMVEAFIGCTSLETVEATNWDTSNVIEMTNAFHGCTNLKNIDVSNWDVSKVTNFYCMFYNCASLANLDVSNWNPGSATNMQYLFGGCTNLEALDVSDWDVSKVEDFYGFAYKCGKLTSLDVSNWDTGSATRMAYMFASCANLTELDPSGFDVSNVTDMTNMFQACLSLKSLDLSSWDVSNVRNFSQMFAGAGSNAMDMALEELNLDGWTPVSATNLSYMFYGCANLKELDLSDWQIPNVTTSSHMFADCTSLEVIDVSGWKTAKLTSMDAMFNDCRSLKTVDVSTFDTSKVKEFSQLFEACWSLTHITGLENWNTTSAATFEQMFLNCSALKELNLSSFSTYTAQDRYYAQNNSWSNAFTNMFSGVTSLEKLTLGANFTFEGNGSVAADHQVKLPNPAGSGTVWYNAENDTYYAASEIPDETAATYVAAVKP